MKKYGVLKRNFIRGITAISLAAATVGMNVGGVYASMIPEDETVIEKEILVSGKEIPGDAKPAAAEEAGETVVMAEVGSEGFAQAEAAGQDARRAAETAADFVAEALQARVVEAPADLADEASAGFSAETDVVSAYETSADPADGTEEESTGVEPPAEYIDETDASEFEYRIEDGEAVIVSYRGSGSDLVIPDELEGYPVTAIASYAFLMKITLKNVTIPETVVDIGTGAFRGCSSLETVVLPSGLKTLSSGTFSGCTNLGKGQAQLTLPAGLEVIENNAFYNCRSIAAVTFPESLSKIGGNAFTGCTALEKITVPGAPVIDDYVFSGCRALIDVSLSDDINKLGIGVFEACSSLETITLPQSLKGISEECFMYCSSLREVAVNEKITYIYRRAFYECTSLQTMVLPQTVTNIGNEAFSGCYSLEGMYVPESVISIGTNCLEGCRRLTLYVEAGSFAEDYAKNNRIPYRIASEWTMPEIKVSGDYRYEVADGRAVIRAYTGTETIVSIPEALDGYAVTAIGDAAFEGAAHIQQLEIPSTVQTIGIDAFRGCSGIAGTLVIPNSVKEIGTYAFSECSGIEEIQFSSALTELAEGIFEGCSSLKKVSIPANIKTLGTGCFQRCSDLQTVELPEGLTGIGNMAFYLCVQLQSVEIPGTVITIGTGAFYQCYGLQEAVFSEGLKTIGDGAFASCRELTKIIIPASVTAIRSYAFSECKGAVELCVPGPADIAQFAFNGCSSLTSVSLADEIIGIGRNAFENCMSLTEIALPRDLLLISEACFAGCTALETVTHGGIFSEIGANAFSGCRALKELTITDYVLTIGDHCFDDCDALLLYVERGSIAEDYAVIHQIPYKYIGEQMGAVSGLKALGSGKNQVLLTWNAVKGADRYMIYAQKNNERRLIATTDVCYYTDNDALDGDWNFYWVYPYFSRADGTLVFGGCEKYAYAKGVYKLPAAENLRAVSIAGGVWLGWDAVEGADGYLVYGKDSDRAYGYIGMTTDAVAFTDTKASTTDWNFYWIFPFYWDSGSNRVIGTTGQYAYNKALLQLPAVTGQKAVGTQDGVVISWDAVEGADGYLIYHMRTGGTYSYLTMTTKGTTVTDREAPAGEYSFYWIFAYEMTSSGRRLVGEKGPYIFALGH